MQTLQASQTTVTCKAACRGARRSAQVARAAAPSKAPMAACQAVGARSAFAGAALGASAKRATAPRASRVCVAKVGDSLDEFLMQATDDAKLRLLMASMAECCRTIAYKVRTASCAGTACLNTFGDEQLAVDVLADKLLFETLKYSGVCETACSEEVPEVVALGGKGFSVAFDPLDGSSIVDTNFSVGTIFGVWPGANLTGITGRQQAAAGFAVYGPRTSYVIAVAGFPGTHEFLLMDDGKWLHVKETTEIGEGKLFSPGNLRCTVDNPQYAELIKYYVDKQYTLRYTGGMVPDVFQILVKEKGIFTNVISPSTKAKLRLVFECAPIALLVENAGGYSSGDGQCKSALDIPVTGIDQRTQVAFGSKLEVARFEKTMYGAEKATRFKDVLDKV